MEEELPTGSWMLDGVNVESNLAIEAKVTNDTKLEFLTTMAGSKVGISCEEVEIASAELKAGGKASGTAQFTSCSTFIEGELSKVCKPSEPIVMGGTAEIVKHEGATYVKATGSEGTFTTLEFGEECSLFEEIALKGTIWIEDCEGWEYGEEEALVHLIEEGKVPAEALGGLKFGKNAMSIDGSLLIEVFHEGEMVQFSALG